jgi:hypothetical protein
MGPDPSSPVATSLRAGPNDCAGTLLVLLGLEETVRERLYWCDLQTYEIGGAWVEGRLGGASFWRKSAVLLPAVGATLEVSSVVFWQELGFAERCLSACNTDKSTYLAKDAGARVQRSSSRRRSTETVVEAELAGGCSAEVLADS